MIPLIRAIDVDKSYTSGAGTVVVLHGMSVDIHPGECTLLVGPSGSGKTTLLSILAGVLRPSRGDVHLCQQHITPMPEERVAAVRRNHVGFIFQAYNLFPALTALDNVAAALTLRGVSVRTARRAAREALGLVGLDARAGHRPGMLSGGEKQRVAIARTLVANPSVILGDEITAALDSVTAFDVMRVLTAQMSDQRGCLLVTHDRRLEQFADRIIEMEDGRIKSDERPPRRPNTVVCYS